MSAPPWGVVTGVGFVEIEPDQRGRAVERTEARIRLGLGSAARIGGEHQILRCLHPNLFDLGAEGLAVDTVVVELGHVEPVGTTTLDVLRDCAPLARQHEAKRLALLRRHRREPHCRRGVRRHILVRRTRTAKESTHHEQARHDRSSAPHRLDPARSRQGWSIPQTERDTGSPPGEPAPEIRLGVSGAGSGAPSARHSSSRRRPRPPCPHALSTGRCPPRCSRCGARPCRRARSRPRRRAPACPG